MSDGSSLEEDEAQYYEVALTTGKSYFLMGVCDTDCNDLDLLQYDGYDNLISQDESTDAYPITSVTVARGGLFNLYVAMYDCDVNPCYYGVGLYGNQASGNPVLYEVQAGPFMSAEDFLAPAGFVSRAPIDVIRSIAWAGA